MARESTTRRTRRDDGEWADLLAEQVESGLSQRAFCEARNVAPSSFANAKRRLRPAMRGGEAKVARDFVPLRIGSEALGQKHWDVELVLGDGLVLRLRSM